MRADHGYGRYTAGCRCPVCRKAKAAYMRRKRAGHRANRDQAKARGERYIADRISHGYAGYQDYACRCTVCVAAHRDRQRKAVA